MVDTGVYRIAHELVQYLETELAETRAGAPAIALVHPGNMTPDYGCMLREDTGAEGMAWTRVVSIAPTLAFPSPQSGPAPGGRVAQLVATIEIGVTRCYPGTDDNGMPAVAALDSAARDAVDDAAAMRAAVAAAFDGGEVVVQAWVPRGNQGGIHGGTMTVQVCVDTCAPGSAMPPLDTVVPPLPGDPRA